jgi:hypothetical protein
MSALIEPERDPLPKYSIARVQYLVFSGQWSYWEADQYLMTHYGYTAKQVSRAIPTPRKAR